MCSPHQGLFMYRMFDDEDASSDLGTPLVFPGEDIIRRNQLKQYRITIVILGIVACGLLITVICSAVFGFGCKQKALLISKHPSGAKFFHMSDLHLDNYYDSTVSTKTFCRKIDPKFNITPEAASFIARYGRIGCDSPKELVELAIGEAANLTKTNDIMFVLLTGDQSAHRMEDFFTNGTAGDRVISAMKSVRALFEKHLPDLPLIPSFGNNDLPGDYNLPANPTFYSQVVEVWKPLLLKKCKGCNKMMVDEKELMETFLKGGYYKAHLQIQSHDIVILSLNTNYWVMASYKPYRHPPPHAISTADAQMKWLEAELKAATKDGKTAIVTGHVPPGIDPYEGSFLWFYNYTQAYMKLVTDVYKDTVIAQFYGHFHKDEFKVQTYKEFDKKASNDMKNFILLAPGVTPVYSNNPSYRLVEVDKKDGLLLDYTQYYMDIVMATEFGATSWEFDYRFSGDYGLRPTADDMMTLSNRLIDSADKSRTWNKYIRHRQVNYQSRAYSRFQLYCASRFTTKSAYDQCLTKYKVPGG